MLSIRMGNFQGPTKIEPIHLKINRERNREFPRSYKNRTHSLKNKLRQKQGISKVLQK
jgi:hypothetical protein